MRENPYREDREELKELLKQYQNLKTGRKHSFLEEDDFERIIDHFDEKDDLPEALEASEMGLSQFPYSSQLMIKKADLLLATRKYTEALNVLEMAELYDSSDLNLYILKTDAYLALDQQAKAVELLEAALQLFEGEERLDLLFELADVYDDYEEALRGVSTPTLPLLPLELGRDAHVDPVTSPPPLGWQRSGGQCVGECTDFLGAFCAVGDSVSLGSRPWQKGLLSGKATSNHPSLGEFCLIPQ